MTAGTQYLPDEAITYIQKIRDVCGSIEKRVAEFPSQSKTLTLIRSHIQEEMLPECRRYLDALGNLQCCQLDAYEYQASSAYRESMSLCSARITQVLELFALLQLSSGESEEVDEFDGLNAEFAKLYVTENRVPSTNDYERVKMVRMSNHMVEILASGLTVNSVRPENPEPMYEVAGRVLKPQIEALSETNTRQFQPRYIHKYPTPAPYRVDLDAEPAAGSYGIVRKATSALTGNVVAIKTIKNATNRKERRMVLHELAVLEVCDHPNLMRLVDAYETPDGKVHMALAPWAPFTLGDFTTRHDASLAASCPWFEPGNSDSDMIIRRLLLELAGGILHLHRKAIKHKDIKPENILLYMEGSSEVRPIITDFGKSKIYTKGAKTDFVDSTYPFLAPEQLQKTESSLKSDVWQLGCCFALILGRSCGGFTALEALESSYSSTASGRSCNIGQEIDSFLPRLRIICQSQAGSLNVTSGMLEKDPAARSTMENVWGRLQDL